MKFSTFNTNSIRARLPIIVEWLDREQPDVLCLQETKVQDKDFPAGPFNEIGYHALYRGQKAYNGVAIISKLPTEKPQLNLYNGNKEDARFVSSRIGDIPVINVYVPQGDGSGTSCCISKKLMILENHSCLRETSTWCLRI